MFAKSVLLTLLLTTFTAAQNLTGEPDCAVECLRTAIAASICDPNDQGCQCTVAGKASIQALSTDCLLKACALTELLTAQRVGNDLCVAYSSSATGSGITTSTGLIPTTGTTGTSVFVAPTTTSDSPSMTSITTSGLSTSTTSILGSTTTSVVRPSSTGTSAGAASTTSSSTGAAMPTAVANFAAVVGGIAAILL